MAAELRFVGFCGVDDSVSPELLLLLSERHPWIEWGVLFRPAMAGKPRFASEGWVRQLSECCRRSGGRMRLAAHLCGSRCEEVLRGETSFVESLRDLGFRRVQVNATVANGVDTSALSSCVDAVRSAISRVGEIEWIFQLNAETRPLWDPILNGPMLSNCSVLFDESVGTGKLLTTYSAPLPGMCCGYAGGIGPANIADVLAGVGSAAAGRRTWVDMESGLRATLDGRDVFDVNKVFACVMAAVGSGLKLSTE